MIQMSMDKQKKVDIFLEGHERCFPRPANPAAVDASSGGSGLLRLRAVTPQRSAKARSSVSCSTIASVSALT